MAWFQQMQAGAAYLGAPVVLLGMPYSVEVVLLPHAALLDPQGKATRQGLHNLGFTEVQDVRIGKHIVLVIDAASEEEARARASQAAEQLLCNRITESFEIAAVKALA